ncbi:MAG: hypothetical protein HOE90_23415 [Bacteriovoracaceae bacterium]|jgi:hypothetical protein|nr:hypothetical protein [Bacteriovoracaceae bacterium]
MSRIAIVLLSFMFTFSIYAGNESAKFKVELKLSGKKRWPLVEVKLKSTKKKCQLTVKETGKEFKEQLDQKICLDFSKKHTDVLTLRDPMSYFPSPSVTFGKLDLWVNKKKKWDIQLPLSKPVKSCIHPGKCRKQKPPNGYFLAKDLIEMALKSSGLK